MVILRQVVKKKTATDDGLFNFFPDVAADEEGNESKEEGEPSGKPAVGEFCCSTAVTLDRVK